MVGYVSNRIMESAEALKQAFCQLTENVLMKVAVIVSSLITLYFVHHEIGTIFIIWIAIFMVISTFSARRAAVFSGNYARKRSLVTGKIVDAISNISSILMYINYKFEREYIGKYLDENIKSEQNLH